MSPTDRENDAEPRAAVDRPSAAGSTPVAGADQVRRQLEQQLAHCRRARTGLALLRVAIEQVAAHAGAGFDPDLERRVCQEVAHRIGHAVRGGDLVLRESDRETWVVLPGGDPAVAERVGGRLARLASGDYRVGGSLLEVTVRLGEAVHPRDGARASELIARAAGRD